MGTPTAPKKRAPEFMAALENRDELIMSLEPEEVAGFILHHLSVQPPLSYQLNLINFLRNVDGAREPVLQALTEAWAWLDREGLIARKPGTESWFFVTRRGESFAAPPNFASYRKVSQLPRKLLHPRIAEKVWPLFLRGDFDTAVFQSFKELEVCVRHWARLSDTDIGVDLMRKAFDPNSGPLSDLSAPPAERQAVAHLMAGAIGLYKNPHSHRNLPISAAEAAEMVLLGSHLIAHVERRMGWRADDSPPVTP